MKTSMRECEAQNHGLCLKSDEFSELAKIAMTSQVTQKEYYQW